MFASVMPMAAVEQLGRAVNFTEWQDVYVGCSDGFRIDRAIRVRHPTIRIHSSDPSLLSAALGAVATGSEIDFTFKGRLSFIERELAGRPFVERVAALEVASEMGKYRSELSFSAAHF